MLGGVSASPTAPSKLFNDDSIRGLRMATSRELLELARTSHDASAEFVTDHDRARARLSFILQQVTKHKYRTYMPPPPASADTDDSDDDSDADDDADDDDDHVDDDDEDDDDEGDDDEDDSRDE